MLDETQCDAILVLPFLFFAKFGTVTTEVSFKLEKNALLGA